MKHSYSAGGVVINQKGQVVVVSQMGKSWSLPKGHVNEGENLLAAAKREIYEESGVTNLELIEELGTYQRLTRYNNNEMKNITFFLFKTSQEVLAPQDKQNPQALWIEQDKVADLLTHQKDKDFFLSIIKKLS